MLFLEGMEVSGCDGLAAIRLACHMVSPVEVAPVCWSVSVLLCLSPLCLSLSVFSLFLSPLCLSFSLSSALASQACHRSVFFMCAAAL